ncbi:MAG: sugar ABC transporter permease, partial [Spirochaetia bacterium]|nr:sugar ABC transporter permease [Spirochaetia bacterium]
MPKAHTLLDAKREQKRAYWTLVLPGFLIYISVMAFPTIFSIFLSISDYNGGKLFGGKPISFVGLKWYGRLFVDEYFYLALKNNLYIVLVSVFGQIPLGFFLAYVLYRGIVKKADFFQTM